MGTCWRYGGFVKGGELLIQVWLRESSTVGSTNLNPHEPRPPPRLCNPDQLLALWTKTVSKFVEAMETGTKDSGQAEDKKSSNKTKCVMNIQGYPVKGLSIAGHETCIIFPSLNIAFDIGRCPHQAIQQDFLCISHAHMNHIKVPSSSSMAEATKRYAVVTGGNKGIGFETCRQLALNGVTVVLTSRDEKRGLEAVDKLKESGLSDLVLFHQLDVTDPASIASLADFIKATFGKLDILVNNAGILGATGDADTIRTSAFNEEGEITWNTMVTQTYELTEECLETNYYGAKRMVEALNTLLQLSHSPTIVNVSSFMGKLKEIPNEWAQGVLTDAESLTEEKLDEVLSEFLKDFKEGYLEAKGWPAYTSAYIVSKAVLNAYTRILAKKYPSFCINCLCPGYVNTDINFHLGPLAAEESAKRVLRLALLPSGGPSGLFFTKNEVTPF